MSKNRLERIEGAYVVTMYNADESDATKGCGITMAGDYIFNLQGAEDDLHGIPVSDIASGESGPVLVFGPVIRPTASGEISAGDGVYPATDGSGDWVTGGTDGYALEGASDEEELDIVVDSNLS